MLMLQIIYASTSGHTEHVVDTLIQELQVKDSSISIAKKRAEEASPDDLLQGDVLLLASSTWNTGSAEGQLNPHMHMLLKEKAKDVDLAGKKVALIALGDHRYRYTAHAAVHLEEFVKTHHGTILLPTLKIVDEPYGQEDVIKHWTDDFLSHLHGS